MKDIRRWFLALVIIGPIHMGEQMIMGLDELAELQGLFAKFYAWFGSADYATVTLVTISFTVVNLLGYGLISGGRAQTAAIGFFALLGVGEIHHIIRVLVNGTYYPGAVTSIPYFIFGVLLTRALLSANRQVSGAALADAAA